LVIAAAGEGLEECADSQVVASVTVEVAENDSRAEPVVADRATGHVKVLLCPERAALSGQAATLTAEHMHGARGGLSRHDLPRNTNGELRS
jgi:hypothetical protein